MESGTKNSLTTIEKRNNLSADQLFKEYIKPEIPVILTDATDNWGLKGKITPEYLKEKYGHITKSIKGIDYKLSDYVNLMLKSTPENPAPYPYNLDVEHYFPELLAGFKPEVYYGKSDRIHHPLLPKVLLYGTTVYEIFLGGNGASFPFLHYDELFMHTQITQLYGSKEFYLYPPEQSAYMYPDPDRPKVSQVNTLDVDYEKFPLFAEAKPIVVMVNEGETLLFPKGWWHTTRIYEPMITLGRAQLNGSNWKLFMEDNYKKWNVFHPKLKPLGYPVMLYGKALGKLIDLQESM